jgi:hypothetical protein
MRLCGAQHVVLHRQEGAAESSLAVGADAVLRLEIWRLWRRHPRGDRRLLRAGHVSVAVRRR